jgi:hypothetical protein
MKKNKKERKKTPAVVQTRDRCFLAIVYKDVERVCVTEIKGVERLRCVNFLCSQDKYGVSYD